MTEKQAVEQAQGPKPGASVGVIVLAAVMIVASAPVVVHQGRTADLASWVPWLLALGPVAGLLITWLGGSFRDASPTPRAQTTHFALAGVMVVLMFLVIALDGPTGLVVSTLVYCVGFLLLQVTSLSLWQQRRPAGQDT